MSVQYPAVYNSETSAWQSIAGQSLPEGGDDGQVLTKSSSASYDVGWETLDLSTKADKLLSITSSSASYFTLSLSDANKLVETTNSSFVDVIIPTNSSVPFPIGTQITVLQGGTGQFGLSPDSGVTLYATPGVYSRTQWSIATLIKKDTDTWVAAGDLTA